MAEALYRKYRPQVFEDVVGQEPIERTLKNALAQDKVSHAYLFCGPRGTGKTTTARLLAKALLCQQGPTPDPDGTCEDCQLIAEGVHPDVYELDAASRTGVENVREEIISRVQFAPTRGRSKVYIIDEVHMLSTAAFNALLKTLEEPPQHVVFILCTTDPQKVPETIHSRCQRFDFRRIAPETMVSRLGAICMAEDVEFEGEALDLIAQRAEGGLRNALTSLEQIIAFENGKVTLAGAERLLGSIDSSDLAEIMTHVGRRDIANCFRWTAGYVETGADLAQFVRDMSEHVRNLYVMALVGDDAEIEVSETTRRQLASELQWFGPDRASRLLGVLGDLSAELKTSSNPRLAFEIALTRMVRPDSDLTLESLAERVEALESGYSAVAHVLPGQPLVEERHPFAFEEPAAPAVDAWQPQAAAAPSASAAAAAESFAQPQGDGRQRAAMQEPARSEAVAPATRREVASVAEPASAARVEQAAQPAAVGAQPAAASGSALDALSNPAALQRAWQATMTAVKKQKQAHGVLFMNTKARFDAATGVVRITFPAENAFAFNAVQKGDVRDALAEALRRAVGVDVPFEYEQAGSAPAAAAELRPVAAAQPQPVAERRVEPAQRRERSAPEPQPQPVAQQPVALLQPEPQPAAQPQQQPQVQRQPQPQPVPDPYDEVPYEQVPYEDLAYDPVPYEEFDAPQPRAAQPQPQVAQPQPQVSQPQAVASPAPDAQASASPAYDDGADAADAADIQAMLQAGFGGNVVFSEIDE